MKNLIEISKIVTKKKVKKIEIFDDATLKNKSSKFNEFYEALLNSKFRNDRDAALYLYNCNPTDDKYRQLKSRFRKRLLNTLFFLDVNTPSASNYDRAYFSCNKDWTLVKILLSNQADFTAATIAQQILSVALKFHFADIIVNCSRILREDAAKNNDEKEYETYDQYIKQYANILDAEIRSEELYQRVFMNYHETLEKNEALLERIDTYCDALVGLSEMYESPIIVYNMYLVWAYRYEMLKDWEAMLQVCSKAEKYIEDNPMYYQEEKLTTFQLKKMSAYLHLRDFKNGKTNAEKCLQSFAEGSEIWFTFMEYYLMLAIHSDTLVNALAIYNKAISNTKFKKLPPETREKWEIYNVYINYLVEIQGEGTAKLLAQKKKTFKVQRLLNDPVLYPKEQRMFTIHLVIAQFLFLIDKGGLQQATEAVERLRNYANHQLKQENYYRTIQFIRLLQQLVKADFKVEELSNTEKYYSRLIEHPFFYRGLLNELEIIPYDKLWKLILSQLTK